MKVKKFQAPSMNEAVRMIKAELGNDAVILNTKKIKKSDSYGLFSREWIEIEAAIDNHDSYESFSPEKHKRTSSTYDTGEIASLKNIIEEYIGSTQELKREMPQLKKMLALLMKQSGVFPTDSLDDKFISLYEDLTMQEVSEHIAHKLIENLSFEVDSSNRLTLERLRNLLKIKMRNKIKIFTPEKKGNLPQITAFIGPTGVGKTTTLAKIAAKCRLIEKKKTALFTFDTYRIAAVEQLKIYGDILKTPVIVVNKKSDFKEKIQSFKN